MFVVVGRAVAVVGLLVAGVVVVGREVLTCFDAEEEFAGRAEEEEVVGREVVVAGRVVVVRELLS